MNKNYLLPPRLASYDIVFTTFTVLSAELPYVSTEYIGALFFTIRFQINELFRNYCKRPFSKFLQAYSRNHNLRNPKRYHSFLTPLTRIQWWRVCVDEAQMVETANKVSEMAMQLKFVNIWAVTGTPVGKSLNGTSYFSKYVIEFVGLFFFCFFFVPNLRSR